MLLACMQEMPLSETCNSTLCFTAPANVPQPSHLLVMFSHLMHCTQAVMFACKGLAVTAPADVASGTQTAATANVAAGAASAELNTTLWPSDSDPSYSLAFSLSSRPSAGAKIFLQFRGGTVSGTVSMCVRHTSFCTAICATVCYQCMFVLA